MIKQFLKDRSGNFALTFALASLPIMLGIGAAVDYASVSQHQTKLQNSIDAAILAVGQDFESKKKAEIKAEVKDFLKANLTPEDFSKIEDFSIDIDKANHRLTVTVTVTANASIDTSFMMLAGIDKMKYDAIAQIKSANGGAEIVFVLDNTGSMSLDGKLDALKSAATTFTQGMMVKDTGGSVKIRIVPFSNYVNVGLANRNASWLDVEDDSSTTNPNYCYMTQDFISKSGCSTQNGVNSEGIPYSYEQCTSYVYGDPYEVCQPQVTMSYPPKIGH